MSSQSNRCRLCVKVCQESKGLYNKNGRGNVLHHVIANFFEPKILNMKKWKNLTSICLKCWRHIRDFHKFQQHVIEAQTQLSEFRELYKELDDMPESPTSHTHEDDMVVPQKLTIAGAVETENNDIDSKSEIGLIDEVVDVKPSEPRYVKVKMLKSEEEYQSSVSDDNAKVENEAEELEERIDSIHEEDSFMETTEEIVSFYFDDDHVNIIEVTADAEEEGYDDTSNHMRADDDDDAENVSNFEIYEEDSLEMVEMEVDYIDENVADDSMNELENTAEDENDAEDEHKLDLKTHNPNVSADKDDSFNTKSNMVDAARDTDTANEVSDNPLAKWLPIINCVICSVPFKSLTTYREHFRQAHNRSKFYIVCCNRKLYRPNNIEDHVRLHQNPEAFKCVPCNKCYVSRSSLNKHMLTEHRGKSQRKDIVTKRNKTSKASSVRDTSEPDPMSNELYHKLLAIWIPLLKCVYCSEIFTNFAVLRSHYTDQHRGKVFYITCCERKLYSRCHIEEHLQYHNDPDTYRCEPCGISYQKKSGLREHIARKHAGQKALPDPGTKNLTNKEFNELLATYLPELKCDYCPEIFQDFSLLRFHFFNQHPGKTFQIICCGRKLYSRSHITEHLLVHNDPDTFRCEPCSMSFTTQRSMKDHMLRLHTKKNKEKGATKGQSKKVPAKDKVGQEKTNKSLEIAEKMTGSSKVVTRRSIKTELHAETKDKLTAINSDSAKLRKRQPDVKTELIAAKTEKLSPNASSSSSSLRKGVLRPKKVELSFENSDPLADHDETIDELEPNENDTLPTDNDSALISSSNLNQSIAQTADKVKFDHFVSQWLPDLTCAVCSETFTQYSVLRLHFTQSHPSTVFYITCCDRKLKQPKHIEQHFRYHQDDRAFECRLCGECKASKSALGRHMSVYHPETLKLNFTCKFCGKGLSTASGLKNHYSRIHSTPRNSKGKLRTNGTNGKAEFNCKDCGHTLRTLESLKTHCRRNHPDKISTLANICKVCGSAYKQAYLLRRHMVTHMKYGSRRKT